MRTTPKGRSYQIDLIPDEDGGYTVVVPALPGCISYGESVVDANETPARRSSYTWRVSRPT